MKAAMAGEGMTYEQDRAAKDQDATEAVIRMREPGARGCITDYETWLRQLAAKGGKGVVNNIDARSLLRVAQLIARQREVIRTLREANADLEALEVF